MISSSFAKKAVLYTLTLGLVGGCLKDRQQKADDEEGPEVPQDPVSQEPITAQKSGVGLLDVKVELRDDGMLLHVGNVPAGSTLECHLDDKALVPCHDGALYARPTDGDHKISALAMKDGVATAIGESQPFTVLAGTGGDVDPDNNPRNPLNLQIDDLAFANGAIVPMTKDFVLKFKFTKEPKCDQLEVRCQYDSRTSPFMVDCDEGGKSFTISKDLLALGLQYFTAQAFCAGEPGPALTVHWWGVPDETYQPLALTVIKDSSERNIVNLIKADDCPESMQRFECAAAGSDEFALCANGNVIDQPEAGYRVRMTCEGRQGPALTLGE